MSSHPAVPFRRACSLAAALALAACSPDSSRSTLAPTSPSLSAASVALRFHGTLETATKSVVPIGPGVILAHSEGTGTASHLGRYEMFTDLTLNVALGTGTEEMAMKAANGDLVYATVTSQGIRRADGVTIDVVENATIIGGTGRFAGATGHFVLKCVVNQAAGTATGAFDGTITLVH
jgi:hypothetical protein